MSNKQYFTIVIFVVVSILGAFYSGYYLKNFVILKESLDSTSNEQLFKPNFIDEAIFVTKDTPRKVLILSAIRTFVKEDSNNYTLKVFYFDGVEWISKIIESKSPELVNIPKTLLIPNWSIEDDPSYMLKQSISGEVMIDENNIKFEIPIIYNEMAIRSSYKYTKFMSESDGNLIINDELFDSHSLYSRIYSFSPPESLVFTSDPSGIETEWVAFWDNDGNFYSIDETVIDNKRTFESYKAHSLGILKDNEDRVQKSFTLNLIETDFKRYSVEIKDEINKTLSINKINSVNKAVNQTDTWFTGFAEGEVTSLEKTVKGFGVYEQISQ